MKQGRAQEDRKAIDPSTLAGSKPEPFSACRHCGSTAFDEGRAVGLAKEIFCRQCRAAYLVNVAHDGLFLVEELGLALRPARPSVRPGYRRRSTDDDEPDWPHLPDKENE